MGGKFYFSVPMGFQRIEFNAHRVFSTSYLIELFKGKFEIEEFSYVNDKGDFFENVPLKKEDIDRNFGCFWDCEIFTLKKVS